MAKKASSKKPVGKRTKSAGRKKPAAKSKTKKPAKPAAPQKTIVNSQSIVARHFKVHVNSVQKWVGAGMPGLPGNYCLEDIKEWRDANLKRKPEDNADLAKSRQAKAGDMVADRARLLKAQADEKEAQAKIVNMTADLKEGNYADLDDVNTFMSEFLTETRRLLLRIPVEMAPGYQAKIRSQIREDVSDRIGLVMDQMYDWLLRTEELRSDP